MVQATAQSCWVQHGIAHQGGNAYPLGMKSIVTPRLRLVPATAETIRLEMENPPGFFQRLGIQPIPDWPSDNLADVLPLFLDQLMSDASLVGWLAWYWILDTPQACQLVGGGGFKGAPVNGSVEIGYETRAAYRRTGIASEAVDAQVVWALGQPGVERVIAETREDNVASRGVLTKLGFTLVGDGLKSGLLCYEMVDDLQSG